MDTSSDHEVSYTAMKAVAERIACCDFRVTALQYQSIAGPWVLAVGEFAWRRYIIIMSVADSDAELGILPSGFNFETTSFGDTSQIERVINLNKLIAGNYSGVKRILTQEVQTA